MRTQKSLKLSRYNTGKHSFDGDKFKTDDQVRISGRGENGSPAAVLLSEMLLEVALLKRLRPGDRVLISVETVDD